MSVQFERRARLTVGSLQVESEGEKGLRFAFTISKSTKLSENSARAQIYNLSEDTRARLSEEASRFDDKGVTRRLLIEAGYGSELRQLFTGDRVWIGHSRSGSDWVTSVETLDGVKALSQQVNLSFAPKITGRAIFEQLKTDLKLAWNQVRTGGDVLAALDGVSFDAGKVLTGSGRKALDEIADEAGLEVSVQDGELLLYKPGGTSPNTGLVLSSTTGLVGTPETFADPSLRTGNKSGSAKAGPFGKHKNLVRGKCLLNGLISPGRRFVLDSKSAFANAGATFGMFRAIRVQHVGDLFGGDESWLTSWEAEEASA